MTRIEFDANRLIFLLLIALIGVEILFLVGDEIFDVRGLIGLGPVRRFFDMAREDSLASWFAVTQTWMLGLTAAFIYAVVCVDDDSRWRRVGWAVLAIVFLYMAMDDGTKFHERIGSSVRRIIQGENADSGTRQIGFFPSYTWQLVFLPMFATFGVFILWFLNKELQFVRDKLMVVAAIGLFVLAVTADFFEGIEGQHPLNLQSWISTTWDLNIDAIYHYSQSFEEFIEMLAISFLWVVFLRHLVSIAPEIQLRFQAPPRE